ncbi:hypothetical protein UlMin_014280 [Ulmus minor]
MDHKNKSNISMIWFVNSMLYFLISFLCTSLSCSAIDTTTHEDIIRDEVGKTLVSAGGKFELGFFTPDNEKHSMDGEGKYVGIWYYNLSTPRTVVWIANRDKPLPSSNTGFLSIGEDGNLQVSDMEGNSYWSTNLEQKSSSNRTVKLMDSGNLVFQGEDGRSLWESFKYPADTFLPGMKMDQSLTLTSWKDKENPGTGDFTFQQEQEGNNIFVIKNKSITYWKSGEAGKFFSFDNMPGEIKYFLLNINNTHTIIPPTGRLVINSNGKIEYLKWDEHQVVWSLKWSEPRDRCSEYNFCGDFGSCNNNNSFICKCLPGFQPSNPKQWSSGDFSGGCMRKTGMCSGKNETFLRLKMKKVGPIPESLGVNNEKDCRNGCLGNSRCQAYSFVPASGGSHQMGGTRATCWIWPSNLNNLQEYADGGYILFARVVLFDIKSTARNCNPCNTTTVPYPLSTGPDCGDSGYNSFHCDNSTGRLTFEAITGKYPVISIDPNSRIFFIQVQMGTCEAKNPRWKTLQLNRLLPFTSVNTSCSNVTGESSPVGYTKAEIPIFWNPPREPTCTTQENCKEWPLSNCSDAADGKKRCLCNTDFVWNGTTLDCTSKREGNTPRLSDINPSGTRVALNLILVPTVTILIVVACGVIVFIIIWRRKTTKKQENRRLSERKRALRALDTERHIKDLMASSEFKDEDEKGIDVPFFDLKSILDATDDFSDANKLGQGGYGPVYKGKFPGGQEIAIKRLSRVSGQGLKEFKNEVVLIARLQHRNLVRLRGYCIEGDEKILLYEYMPNKSLDLFIFDPSQSEFLDWEIRFDIILGIARGLLYLHQDSRLRIIHRDLKTSNILLDQVMNPKISDFGLAKMVGGKQTEANTGRIVGTYGYMAPEYALEGAFSIKSDVFSFGVVLLEIISGKRNTRFIQFEQPLTLLGYAWRLWIQNKVVDLMDPTLQESCKVDQFMKCVNVGLLCVQEDPSDRPTMSNVITMLDSDSTTVPTPKRPAFVLRRGSSTASSSSKPETNTEITISLEEGR